MTSRILSSIAVLALSMLPFAAAAQSYPIGPVKIVSSVGPGAAPDVITRIVADRLTRLWGHQVIVENRPGGAGAVAIKAVSGAPADGSVLYMAVASNFIALPELQTHFPVDVLHDFVPIGFVGDQPLMIATAPSLGVSTLPEMIALLKKRPGEINIAAGNRGSVLHLAGEWLRKDTGTQFTLLFYAGGTQALPDILGGRVQATIDAITTTRAPIEAGQLKALAVTSKQRAGNFPNVPAASETIPGFEAMGWVALMAPPGTPQGLARKISDDLRHVLAVPELKTRLADLGTYVRPTTPEGLTAFIEAQQRQWGPIIAETAKTMRP